MTRAGFTAALHVLLLAAMLSGAEPVYTPAPGESVVVVRPAEAARLPGFDGGKNLPLPAGTIRDLGGRLAGNSETDGIGAVLFSARNLFGKSPENAVAAIVGLTPEKLKYQLQYNAGGMNIEFREETGNVFSIRPGGQNKNWPDELRAAASGDGKTIFIGSRESVRNAEKSRDWNALRKLGGDYAAYARFSFDSGTVRHPAMRLVNTVTVTLKRGAGTDGRPRLKGLIAVWGTGDRDNARIYLDTANFFARIYADAAGKGQLKPEHTEAFHVYFRNGRTEIELSLTEALARDFITLLVQAFEPGE